MALIEYYTALFQAYKLILTERQYQVLWLHEIELKSGKEISAELNISQSAVSRHLNRGKSRIRQRLLQEREEIERHKTIARRIDKQLSSDMRFIEAYKAAAGETEDGSQ